MHHDVSRYASSQEAIGPPGGWSDRIGRAVVDGWNPRRSPTMELDQITGGDDMPADPKSRSLNTSVAITVALLASFSAICKVKDDNIAQAMQQAQADRNDHWSYYQAHNIRQEIARSALTELQLAAQSSTAAAAITHYDSLVKDQAAKKDSVRKLAGEDQNRYDALNYRDDQFDLSDSLVALAISLLAITALTQRRWLYWVSLVPTLLGVLMGLAGLLGWHLHPDSITSLLS